MQVDEELVALDGIIDSIIPSNTTSSSSIGIPSDH